MLLINNDGQLKTKKPNLTDPAVLRNVIYNSEGVKGVKCTKYKNQETVC